MSYSRPFIMILWIAEPMDRFTALIHYYYILSQLISTHLFTKVTLKVSQKGPNGEPCLALQESVKSPGLQMPMISTISRQIKHDDNTDLAE